MLIDQHAPQTEAGRTALSVAKPYQPALSGKDLGGQFPAVFTGHRPLHALDDGSAQAAVILELLGTIVNRDPALAADEFVVCALIGILETTPAAHVVDKYSLEIGPSASNIFDELL